MLIVRQHNIAKNAAVGEGKVDYPHLLAGLRKLHFKGEWIIEREGSIGEDEKNRDIINTIEYLQQWIGKQVKC